MTSGRSSREDGTHPSPPTVRTGRLAVGIAVLVGAATLATIVGDPKDVIGVVVVLNAVLGFAQEHRAGASLAALERMLVTRALPDRR